MIVSSIPTGPTATTSAVDLILLLYRYSFPSMANDAVYKSVQEQAENFKK
ncbi:hypothetical protein Q4Q54_20815 [Shewanella sp. SP2S2-4]|nr:hypothetical protein [Shewanella sp. SP2S2-4]MDT3275899.1 hypothetical protein [Shewanella sp. SP2S2-4]